MHREITVLKADPYLMSPLLVAYEARIKCVEEELVRCNDFSRGLQNLQVSRHQTDSHLTF